jgi:hypothetical protein
MMRLCEAPRFTVAVGPKALCSLLAVPMLLAVACSSGSTPSRGATTAATSVNGPQPHLSAGLSADVQSSDLVVGQNRFSLGIEDRQGQPLPDASVHFKFFQLVGTPTPGGNVAATLKFEADAVFRAPAREAGLPAQETVTKPDGSKVTVLSVGPDVGVYTATVKFDAPGAWAVEADVTGKDAVHSGVTRTPFQVKTKSETPAVGDPAPPSQNLTVKDVTDLSQIDSSAHPSPDMHTETVAEAIAQHHPTLVLFATPGYCQSRFCGPELEIARKLEPKYAGKADFIHIEIWKDPLKTYMPAVLEWHLPTEPWFFIIDRNGKIAAKFEGPTTMEELDEALQQVTS